MSANYQYPYGTELSSTMVAYNFQLNANIGVVEEFTMRRWGRTLYLEKVLITSRWQWRDAVNVGYTVVELINRYRLRLQKLCFFGWKIRTFIRLGGATFDHPRMAFLADVLISLIIRSFICAVLLASKYKHKGDWQIGRYWLYGTVPYRSVPYGTVPYARRNTVKYGTVRYRTVRRCNVTVQYGTVRYGTMP